MAAPLVSGNAYDAKYAHNKINFYCYFHYMFLHSNILDEAVTVSNAVLDILVDAYIASK